VTVIEHRLPMDEEEQARIVSILQRANWVKQIRCPGSKPDEISIDTHDDKSWRIARPLHLVRLQYRYQQQ
jgi:hypothetical protein